MSVVEKQKEVCREYGVEFLIPDAGGKLGIALSTLGKAPVNGLRSPAENGTCCWYIWCGEEFSEAPDFFKPLHVKHIKEYLSEVERYLGLPVSYRFL